MATEMVSMNGKAGLSSLFPPRRKEDSLHDHVKVLIQRSKADFFRGLDDDQLRRLPDHVRPRVPVTDDTYRRCVTKSVRVRCTKLVFAYETQEAWGAVFREKLQKPKDEGGFGTLEATYKDAERLWREHSPDYKPGRSVARPGKLPDGRLNIRRTRQPEDTEAGYRKRLRQESVSEDSEDQRIDGAVTLWQERILPMRPAVHDMIEKLMKRGVAAREAQQARQELEAIIEDYQPPQRPAQALGDCLFLEIHRRLFDTNNNED